MFSGHWWTIVPKLQELRHPEAPPTGEVPWHLEFEDPVTGTVELNGRLAERGGDSLLILVHGLGGSIQSGYMARSGRVAEAMGLSCLRVNMRGADRRGGDFYHAGLSEDLERVIASPAVASYERLWILGFSLGGHLALLLGTHCRDPRLAAVAAVCSPLNLLATVQDFDRGRNWVYRQYILRSLATMADAMAENQPMNGREVRRLSWLRDFDHQIVAPRFGFDSAEDYYAKTNVAERLHRLRVPGLLVASEGDPMISARSVRAGLGEAPEHLRVVWSANGGHVGFPPDADLGLGGGPGMEHQVIHWLSNQG